MLTIIPLVSNDCCSRKVEPNRFSLTLLYLSHTNTTIDVQFLKIQFFVVYQLNRNYLISIRWIQFSCLFINWKISCFDKSKYSVDGFWKEKMKLDLSGNISCYKQKANIGIECWNYFGLKLNEFEEEFLVFEDSKWEQIWFLRVLVLFSILFLFNFLLYFLIRKFQPKFDKENTK